MQTSGSLAGIKVVDLSRMLPGPYCSMLLADHGARVICLEDRRYEQQKLFMHPVYRNKEHMTLNLKCSQGLEIFYKLISDADVLIEGFRPGVVKRLGIDYEAVSGVNPGIVYCSVSGYGQTGPNRDLAGHDINYLSWSGVLDLMGTKEAGPSIPGIQMADLVGGGLNGMVGILLSLLARNRTGRGQYVDISMTDGTLALLPAVLYFWQWVGQSPQREGMCLSGRYGCYNVYQTSDNRYVAVGALERKFWANLCKHFGLEEFIDHQFDDQIQDQIKEALGRSFRQKTMQEWQQELGDKDVCCSGVKTLEEAVEHSLFRERGMIFEHKDEQGNIRYDLGIPVKLSETPGSLRSESRGFGADTGAVLKELGYSKDQIEAFYGEGII